MRWRNASQAAGARFQLLWQTVDTVNTDPADNQIRRQPLSLLAAAHQSRETRLFQMKRSVPGLIWSVLIVFASGLIGCMMIFAAEASVSKAVLVGVFTSSLALALLTVHVLDFPFESALQLPSRDFNCLSPAPASAVVYFQSPEAKSAEPQNRERPVLGCCRPGQPGDRLPKLKFAVDSPLEEGVSSEPVSARRFAGNRVNYRELRRFRPKRRLFT
jgi:hypothetical protein